MNQLPQELTDPKGNRWLCKTQLHLEKYLYHQAEVAEDA